MTPDLSDETVRSLREQWDKDAHWARTPAEREKALAKRALADEVLTVREARTGAVGDRLLRNAARNREPVTIYGVRFMPDPPPPEREPLAFLCTHGIEPETLRPGYQCAGDTPIYPGDTVVTSHTYVETTRGGKQLILADKPTAEVRRA